MGAGYSRTIRADGRIPAYLPPSRAAMFAPPPPSAAVISPATAAVFTPATAAPAGNRVIAFHSSARWRAYLESSKSSNKLIVVDFTAAWCGPCKLIEPTFNGLPSKFTDVDFVLIDVDELMDVSGEYGIQVMPTFLFIKKGQVIDKVLGVKKEELLKKIEMHRLNNFYY